MPPTTRAAIANVEQVSQELLTVLEAMRATPSPRDGPRQPCPGVWRLRPYSEYFWRKSFLSSFPTLVLAMLSRKSTRLGTAHLEITPRSA